MLFGFLWLLGPWGHVCSETLRWRRGAQAAAPSPSVPCLLPDQEEEGVCPLIQLYAPLWGQETREVAGSGSLRAILLRTGPFSSLPWVLCSCSSDAIPVLPGAETALPEEAPTEPRSPGSRCLSDPGLAWGSGALDSKQGGESRMQVTSSQKPHVS